jgi:hypothetical protein
MSAPASDPYERLVDLISRELQLAGEGRFDELAEANKERAALIGTMPPAPPASAADTLRRAALMQERLNIELERGKEALLLAMRELQRAKRTARGYAPAPRGPRISASA